MSTKKTRPGTHPIEGRRPGGWQLREGRVVRVPIPAPIPSPIPAALDTKQGDADAETARLAQLYREQRARDLIRSVEPELTKLGIMSGA